MESKQGRPRRYRLAALDGFKNAELALAAGALLELSERVADQIEDLPAEAMTFAVGQPGLTIGWLAVHMLWAESAWLARVSGNVLPAGLAASLRGAELAAYASSPGVFSDAAAILRLFDELRSKFNLPALRGIADIDREFESQGMLMNVRGVMAQLAWHWTYHSGQIGLIQLQWGSDYTWTFDKELVLPRG